ncbi:MAG: alpha-mannosidase [Clostridia bacterium]|nr:alpha-mannosidase [Clostridia bacterium]
MKKTLHVIPHSHWDREWYLPFEKHRVRLVELFDALIDTMEQNPDYTYYHMDGQYVVIDDYLEIKPHMRDRLLALVRAGRIQVGPWYVLQDEYLTSGEANVRNMLYGIKLCREIGAEPVETGYFPDSFGNISQAPQIVRGFGFDNAVFGRGINDVGSDNQIIKQSGITTSELIWRGADGSEVIGVLFANWYHNAMELPADPDALRERLAAIVASTSRFALTPHLLGMNGCDHQPVQTNLHEVIALAGKVQDEVTVKQSNFKDYVDAIRPYRDTFPVYEGEMNGQLATGSFPLISTSSSHVDIKQKNLYTQHLLERITEPTALLSMLHGGQYPSELLLYAWKKLMQNHPHDSICSCSCDEVYEEMKARFAKAAACGEELRDGALDYLVAAVDTSAVDGDAAIVVLSLEPNRSVLTVKANVDFDLTDTATEIAVCDEQGRQVPAKITYIANQFTYTLPKDRFRQPRYVNRFAVEMQVETSGIGYRVFTVKKQTPAGKTAVSHTENSMENEFLAVKFNTNGTVDVTDKRSGQVYAGQNLFEDTRDHGDLYNYWQAKGDVAVTTADAEAEISLYDATPWSVTFKVAVPMAIDANITTFVTLSDKVARVDFRTVVANRAENHRLRALFPADIDTRYSFADGQFDVVRRNIQPSEIWQNPCNSHRAQAFAGLESEVSTQGLMVANRGLHEYEVLRDGRNTLAVTLLRAVGQIGDWGVFPTPLGQKMGTWTLEYSLIPYDASRRAEAYREGYTFAYPSVVAVGTTKHEGSLPAAAEYVRFDSEYIRMTAFKKAEDRDSAILRLFNTTAETVTLTLEISPLFKKAWLTNLAEERQGEPDMTDGKIRLEIPAKKILTVELL